VLVALILTPLQGKAQTPLSSILNRKVSSINLHNVAMDEALKQLRLNDVDEILIGFEEVPRVRARQRRPISVEGTQVMIGWILDRFIADDPRYTYEVTRDGIINVYPVGAKDDPNDLMNIRVSKVAIHGQYYLPSFLSRLDLWVPALATRLQKAAKDYQAKTRTGRVGFATAGGKWDATLPIHPQVDLELQNLTVRELLNALVLYSVKIYRGRLNSFPMSWKYEFIVDPDAITGLGGYPGWGQIGENIPQSVF